LIIESLQTEAFRNLQTDVLEPCPQVNIFYGDNGQGKTNITEALWLFTGIRSFRTANNKEMVTHGKTAAQLQCKFTSGLQRQQAQLTVSKRRELILNGFPEKTPRRLLGVFPCVVFSPATLSLVQGGPGERRQFLNVALSMLHPSYAVVLSKYIKAMNQRGELLRQAAKQGKIGALADVFAVWEDSMAQLGTQIWLYRRSYLQTLLPRSQEVYSGISGAKEILTLRCKSGGFSEDGLLAMSGEQVAEKFRTGLEESRENDIRLQRTNLGPHRDDLLLFLDNQTLREYGSQGQQRSAALALKIAEATIIKEVVGEMPVALLDDVMSELDAHRQAALLKFFDGWQVYITCCELSHVAHAQAGKAFSIHSGKISAI
jgi:DNA replication and repair protein RecF